jgi:hypothetical protein
MELDPAVKSHVWWKGTIKGAVKGLLSGLVIGAASAILLQFVLIPMFPVIGPAFAGFLTLTPALVASHTAAFSAIPLAIFSGLSGMIGAAIGSGRAAVAAYKQDTEHKMNEAAIGELAQREQMLEAAVTQPSRSVQSILASGPRQRDSFSAAEEARSAEAATPTIH